DLHEGVLVDEHHLGEGREAQELMDRGAIPGQAWRLIVTPLQTLPVAEDRPSGETVFTVTAEDRETADDVVTRFDMGDVGADRLSPAATVRTSTSRGPGWSTWISAISSIEGISGRTAARMIFYSG
ncbi:MAG: hypothetical protein K0S14_3327, partial [Thermomicrobiales bacterium]|nr:hypothetical protein [Thermomicrobiales bacterium]